MSTANRPFRWDLVRPDQLGTLLEGADEPELWFLDELVRCAAKVLARCADGELYFVGRSADSMFDLLSGALSRTSWQHRVHLLPLSMRGAGVTPLDKRDLALLRANLTDTGLSPNDLARGQRPTMFVDLVSTGHTFANLYHELRGWIEDEREAWDVIRRKLRFLGITWRAETSPNTWRWQQNAAWTAEIPANAIRNVSLSGTVWSYFGNHQPKLTPSFHRMRWADERVRIPDHANNTRQALAEAVAIVQAGRAKETRGLLVKHLTAEPAMSETWLRTLLTQLR